MVEPKKQLKNARGYEIPFEINCSMKLDFNENLIGPSPKVLDAIKKISLEQIKFYPTYLNLLEALGKYNDVSLDMILPTNGADEALNYVVSAFVDDDEHILSVTPSFEMTKIYARANSVEFKEIPYIEKWIYPIEEILSAIDDKTKIILVTTPNSPTGELISDENLQRIIDNARNALVLIDETYGTYANKTYVEVAQKYSNVAVIKSLSKDFAIAGLRLGYVISHSQNISYLRAIASPFNVNSIAAIAGIEALADTKHLELVKREVQKSKKFLTEALADVATVYPSETNFLCVDFGEKAEAVFERLLLNGIKTKLFKAGILKNHFRLTIPPLSQAKKLVDVINVKNLLVFDMDGVLIDVGNSYRLAIKKTFEYFSGQELAMERIQEAKNQGGLNNDWDLTEYLLEQSGILLEKNLIVDKFQEFYFGQTGEGFIQNEELLICKNILKNLAKNHQLAVFTGRPRQEALFTLEFFGIRNLFSEVVSMDDLDADLQKPNPYGLFCLMSKLKPRQTFYFGDTIDDMQAAVGAKVHGVGILAPKDKKGALKKLLKTNGAMVVLNNVNDIVKLRELK